VVTPVYNGARYLRECIESVLAQGYANWRYLLLNNRSTDASLEIAQHYARLDSRIRVHDSAEFLPIIDNHNRALSLLDADSDYCKPLMADDRLYPSCIESLVHAALARPRTGLVCCLGMTARGDVLFDYLPADGRAVSHLSGGAACRLSFLEDRHFFGSPSTMLVRADLIRKRAASLSLTSRAILRLIASLLSRSRMHGRISSRSVSSSCPSVSAPSQARRPLPPIL